MSKAHDPRSPERPLGLTLVVWFSFLHGGFVSFLLLVQATRWIVHGLSLPTSGADGTLTIRLIAGFLLTTSAILSLVVGLGIQRRHPWARGVAVAWALTAGLLRFVSHDPVGTTSTLTILLEWLLPCSALLVMVVVYLYGKSNVVAYFTGASSRFKVGSA